MSAGTRSSIVEEFEGLLCSAFPEKRFELKKAVPLEDGWYQLIYLSVDKARVNNYNVKLNKHIFRARKNSNGTWDLMEEEE